MVCKSCNCLQIAYDGLCKVCSYKKRHADTINKILNEEKWEINEIDLILYNILYDKIKVVNELVEKLNNKTLDDVVQLLYYDMKILGRKSQKVELKCKFCGGKVIRTLKYYFQETIFCCKKCSDVYRSRYLSGENSPFYNRVKAKCTNCNKDIAVIPFDYQKVNQYGDNHNFCSQECYYQYRMKYYVNDKHPMFGTIMDEHHKDISRKTAIQTLSNEGFPQTLTRPHQMICTILDQYSINYDNEHIFKYYSVDIYLPDYNLIIEVMGDFWHANPLKYTYEHLHKIQYKDIKRDKSKHTYIKKYYNIEILYLWEDDIINHTKLCEELIQTYIETHGNLNDYNSFNYHMINNTLVLNTDIIQPFFITKNP